MGRNRGKKKKKNTCIVLQTKPSTLLYVFSALTICPVIILRWKKEKNAIKFDMMYDVSRFFLKTARKTSSNKCRIKLNRWLMCCTNASCSLCKLHLMIHLRGIYVFAKLTRTSREEVQMKKTDANEWKSDSIDLYWYIW